MIVTVRELVNWLGTAILCPKTLPVRDFWGGLRAAHQGKNGRPAAVSSQGRAAFGPLSDEAFKY